MRRRLKVALMTAYNARQIPGCVVSVAFKVFRLRSL